MVGYGYFLELPIPKEELWEVECSDLSGTKEEVWEVRHNPLVPNLIPTVLKLFGQQLVTRGTGIFILQDFCGKTTQVKGKVMPLYDSQAKKIIFFDPLVKA